MNVQPLRRAWSQTLASAPRRAGQRFLGSLDAHGNEQVHSRCLGAPRATTSGRLSCASVECVRVSVRRLHASTPVNLPTVGTSRRLYFAGWSGGHAGEWESEALDKCTVHRLPHHFTPSGSTRPNSVLPRRTIVGGHLTHPSRIDGQVRDDPPGLPAQDGPTTTLRGITGAEGSLRSLMCPRSSPHSGGAPPG